MVAGVNSTHEDLLRKRPEEFHPQPGEQDHSVRAVVGERLSLEAFSQLSGNLSGYPFVKVVVDRPKATIHFVNHSRYAFHADYIAENIMGVPCEDVEKNIDEFNRSVYLDPARHYYLGSLALHKRGNDRFFSLETVEIDNMDAEMVRYFYNFVKSYLDPALPVFFKPANHLQEAIMLKVDPAEIPRLFTHELFATSQFIALNTGTAQGRIRAFRTVDAYRRALPTLEWYDIVVMHRVPDDVPRVAGMINAHHTTPLSHTNVLAHGWKIPNAIQIGILDRVEKEGLDGAWVEYTVANSAERVQLSKIEVPQAILSQRPSWSVQQIKLEEPETVNTPIVQLDRLRMSDRYRYGTKAANLGELRNILDQGSERLLGFYRIRRPPRANLLPYLAKVLGLSETAEAAVIQKEAWDYLRENIRIPAGIAIPFSVQQEFLESSPRIQQAIGKLKMALELNSREADSLCLALQSLIRSTRISDRIRNYIDIEISNHLGGVSSFVVRSSSNAEDLEGFSAAGIYESINHVTTADTIFDSIKEVWASLLSPRSVRLRHDVGISLDDCYMGVIIQEEIASDMGGVLVTTNPMNRGDFRNVYINVSPKSAIEIVQGSDEPFQYLYNTVEGGGRTLSIGLAKEDLTEAKKDTLQILAYCGRLLQSHFSPDYTFSAPVDIEWVTHSEGLYILQLRPYSK